MPLLMALRVPLLMASRMALRMPYTTHFSRSVGSYKQLRAQAIVCKQVCV
jgi:hypothetical protein